MDKIFSAVFVRIIIAYAIMDPTWQSLANALPGLVTLVAGLPLQILDELEMEGASGARPVLLIFDDLMYEIAKQNKVIERLFTVGSRKLGISVRAAVG